MKHRIVIFLIICFHLGISKSFADTFVVTSNADSGPGTLREAISKAAANGSSTNDTINFNLVFTDTASITIELLTSLPNLSPNLTIDGTTQPSAALGVSNSKVIIQPKGANNFTAAVPYCLKIYDASNVHLYGLCFRYFGEYPIYASTQSASVILLRNADNLIFGAPGKGNVITCSGYGISKNYVGGTADNCKIQSNFFGIDINGEKALSPEFSYQNNIGGITLTQVNNAIIGGNTPEEGNVFSFNTYGVDFIEVTGKVEIGYNKFCTDYTGNKETNTGSNIGGRDSPADFYIHNNIIAGESEFNAMSGKYLVVNNFFGTNATQTAKFSNGILGFNNCIGSAMIGGNDASTINVFGNGVLGVENNNSTSISILHNSFYCHENQGINHWYNAGATNIPFVTINKITNNLVEGTSKPNAIIEVYYTDTCRFCEGKVFISRFNATSAGTWSYTAPLTGNVTALSTNIDDRSTSDFARPQVDISGAIIKNATCDKPNGSITGMHIISGTIFYWVDENGTTVGIDSNLINVKGGTYQLFVGIGDKGCKISQQFIIGNSMPPPIDPTAFAIVQPSCGIFNGSITYNGYVANSDSAYWTDAAGKFMNWGTLLPKLAQGKYLFYLSAGNDTSCHTSFGPVALINQSGPLLNTNLMQLGYSTCGKANGTIKNITYQGANGSIFIAWQDSTGKVVGKGIDLLNVSVGRYLLKFKDGGGCDTIITPYFIIADSGSIHVDSSRISIKPSGCVAATGGISGLFETGADQLQWQNVTANTNISNSLVLANIPPATYLLSLTNHFGCAASVGPVNVPQASFNAATFSTTIQPASCNLANGNILLNLPADTASYQFVWKNKDNEIAGNYANLLRVDEGNYTLFATDANGCQQPLLTTAMVQLGKPVIDYSAVQLRPDTCNAGTGSITGLQVKGGSGPLTWLWKDSFNNTKSGDITSLGSLQKGIYTITLTDQNNCIIASNPLIVGNVSKVVNPPVTTDLVVPRNTSATILLPAIKVGVYRLWNDAAGTILGAGNIQGLFYTMPVAEDRSYYISYTYGDCSSALAIVHIKVFDSTIIRTPKAFTPNNDGINDKWRVGVQGMLTSYSLSVYNRYGGLVYSSSNITDYWDGTSKGQLLPTGTFVYIINATDYYHKHIRLSGSITLIR